MEQQHTNRSKWPLYLAIAMGGAASMATSAPPMWYEDRYFQGPTMELDQAMVADSAAFTVHTVHDEQTYGKIEISGVVHYALEEEAQDVSLTLVELGRRTWSEQHHTLTGTGRLYFDFTAYAPFDCGINEGEPCVQDFSLDVEAGDPLLGSLTVLWYVTLQRSGDGDTAPEDLTFDIDFPDGIPVSWRDIQLAPEPEPTPEDGRWQMTANMSTVRLAVDPTSAGDAKRFIVRTRGALTGSRVSIRISLSYSPSALEQPVTVRTTVVPDAFEPELVAEHAVNVYGRGSMSLVLTLPDALDCAPEAECEHGFTITFDAEDTLTAPLNLQTRIDAVIEGEGDEPPADTLLEIEAPPASDDPQTDAAPGQGG